MYEWVASVIMHCEQSVDWKSALEMHVRLPFTQSQPALEERVQGEARLSGGVIWIATCISECLADISAWTTAHRLTLNFHKNELLFIPGKDFPGMDLSVTVEDVTVSPSSTVRILNDRLFCRPNITAVARSCRFALYNIHRIQSYLTKDTARLLVPELVISHLDYCNSLLA